MRPLDVTRHQADWDCIVPAESIGAARRETAFTTPASHPGADWGIIAISLVCAATGAVISNNVLLAVSVIALVSGITSVVYREIVQWRRRNRSSYTGDYLLRRDALSTPSSEVIFMEVVDTAVDLATAAQANPWTDPFVSGTDLNNACWHCAYALSTRTSEGVSEALAIRDNLREALDSLNGAIAGIEDDAALAPVDTQEAVEPPIITPSTDPSATLRDSLRSLATGTTDLHRQTVTPDFPDPSDSPEPGR